MNFRVVNLKKLAGFLVSGTFSLLLASSTLAQQNPTGPPPGAGPPPNNNPNLQDRARQVDESRLRSAEMDVRSEDEKNERLLQSAIANMKEDFTRVQVLRNDIARNLIARKPLDYNLVSEQTGEINKRANRLNVYMRAHAAEGEKENNSAELKSEEMIGALVRLCKLIDSFTENPALKDAATVDAKDVAKAKKNKANADRDLLAIIKVSSGLRKLSESLRISQ